MYCRSKYQIFIMFIIYNLALCKKLSMPNMNSFDSKKLSDCKRCTVLTDSFSHWMDRTARGKFEGGDTAWEEAKLKTYSRSEIRLVEIQEGLCSELNRHKDQCYAMAEEAEQPLESWWFTVDPNIHLHTWLCVDKLQYCCPEMHFGESCKLCPVNNKNVVCNGHGNCDGEGTRKGTGHCQCYNGYSGKICEECAKNFFTNKVGMCEPCYKSCEECSGPGAHSCTACREGWQSVQGSCVDINECIQVGVCKESQYCVNYDGSHMCKSCDDSCSTCDGPGPNNCTSCTVPRKLLNKMCASEKQLKAIFTNVLARLGLYTGLLIITVFILRRSKSLASIVIIAIATYIYFLEKVSLVNLYQALSNYDLLL